MQAGFLLEGLYNIRLLKVGNAQLSIDPAYSLAVRSSDGLLQANNLNLNVTLTAAPSSSTADKVKQGLLTISTQIQNSVNNAVTVPVTQVLAGLGMGPLPLNTTCNTPTPTSPSTECFNNIYPLIAAAGNSNNGAKIAAQALQPSNFTCSATNQCAFHPVLQAVNVLPDKLEFVLSPNLANPAQDNLTPFYSLLPASISSTTTNLGGRMTIGVALDCSALPTGSNSGTITTVFTGDSNLAAGTAGGAISQSYWVDNNLASPGRAGLGAPGSPLNGYWMSSDNSQHVNYIDSSGHVHELYIHPGASWVDNDLTVLSSSATTGRRAARSTGIGSAATTAST
jgi:hypothetical protein